MSEKDEKQTQSDSKLGRFGRCVLRGPAVKNRVSCRKEGYTEKYQRYCDQLDKEDNLINNRINWLLASQSLLFTALAIVESEGGDAFRAAIASVVPILGFLSSLLIWLSVTGAIRSFLRYRYLLRSVCDKDDACEYPQLHRDPCNIVLGFIYPLLVPPLLIGVWLRIWVAGGSPG